MRQLSTITGALVTATLALTGCSTPVKEQPRAGFISDYSRLEESGSKFYAFTSPELTGYSAFIVDRPVLLFERSEEESEQMFSDDEIDELLAYFEQRAAQDLSEDGGYEIATEPGPGVGRIRVGFTALDASVGVLNVWLYTKLAGAGLGGAALEAEIVDSQSNEQLAASVQWGSGSRVLRAGLTKLGDAKIQIKRWTRHLRERLDEINGHSTR
ncbi:MAG: DUF3313 family protein [Pseudomonadota bacterium]